ncbi:hypothetical protein Tco_0555592 [Tanacetum coccineum]
MAEQQTIKYAPQWNNMTVDNVTFQTNNVMGNFNYPLNVPSYKPIIKNLLNCPLRKAFTNYPLVVYQTFLREFWSTVFAYDPFPSTDETEQHPLREFLIRFLVLNGQKPLTLDFNTFCSSTVLDYNNGKYVDHPTPEAVKKELVKIANNPSYLDKTLVLKNSFPMAWRILFTFMIQVLDGNYSSIEQVNSIRQLLAYRLITGTEVDIGEIIYSDLVTNLLNKSRLKYISYSRFISCALQVLLGSDYTHDENFGFLPSILSNSNFTKDPSKVIDIELMAYMIVVNSQKDLVSPLPLAANQKKGKSYTVTPTLPKSQGLEIPGALSKKSKRPKSKRPPTETKVSPPKPTEGSEQSHSVSSDTIPDPKDLERNIQLSGTGLPSTLDKGTRKSKPLPESTATHPKDSRGNKQPLNRDITSTTSDKGTAKTTPRPDGSLRDKDSGGNIPPLIWNQYTPYVRAFLLSDDESGEDILGAGKEIDEEPHVAGIAETHHQSPPPQADKPQSSFAPSTEALDTESSSDDILRKYDNTLPLIKHQLVKYLRKMSKALFTRISKDNWENHEEATVNYVDLKAPIDDYYDENIAHRD